MSKRNVVNITTSSPEETAEFGRKMAGALSPGNILAISGCLGAGKTTLIRGIAEGLGIPPREVHSPTFKLLNIYKGSKLKLYHFDAYRLDKCSPEELGFDEIIEDGNIAVIEWAENIGNLLSENLLAIYISVTVEGENSRSFKIEYSGRDLRLNFER